MVEEISFQKGAVVYVFNKKVAGFPNHWEGDAGNGIMGRFPSNLVKLEKVEK